MSRWPVIAVIVVVLAGGGIFYAKNAKPSPVKYETTAIARGNISSKVTATGTLSALVTVQVGSQVSGRIAELHADFNSAVKKGEIIARIDPQLFIAALEQAKASMAQEVAQVEQAKVNFKSLDLQRLRSRQLRAQNLIAQQDLETAEAAADSANANIAVQEAQLAQAKANLHQANTNLAYTTIESPTDGTVISRSVDVGQTVAASLSAPTLFTIAQDLTKMQVDTSVAESDVGKLLPSMPAIFTVDAYPNERFRGKVRQIRNAAQTVQNVVTYDAVIDVDNKELKLKPGMTANVTFVWAEKSDVLRVPNSAMRFKPPEVVNAAASPSGTASAAVRPPGAGPGGPGGHKRDRSQASDKRQIWLLRNEAAAQVPIRIGISDGSVTEVVEGDVHEGDQVITDLANPGSAKPAAGPGGQRTPGFGRF